MTALHAREPRAGRRPRTDRATVVVAAVSFATMIASEALTLARVEPFYSWNTPICWTAFIVCVDSVVYAARGESWIRSQPRGFAWLTILSIPLWLVFEGYNLVIRNWRYEGLPENPALRLFGYAWSFATIWPAIFEGADLVALVSGHRRAHWSGAAPARLNRPALSAAPALPAIVAGALMLVSPFLVSPAVARYLAAPVWLGFIFLLDPINKRLGGPSLFDDRDGAIALLVSGLLCGVLWEFWNYWSGAKWHYTVPIMEHAKIFEMPLPGYLGFPPFALECFTMFTFTRLLLFRRTAS